MTQDLQRRSKGHRDTGVKTRLVEAARRCVRARGLAATSSRAIADAAGENLGAITYYFGSKEALLATALADELAGWMQPVMELLSGPDDPATRLLGAVNALNATFDEQRDRVPGLLEVFVHAAGDPERRNPVAGMWRDLRVQLAAVITELRARGAVPAWVDPGAMAALILAVGAGTVVSATVEPASATHRDIATQFVALLLAAQPSAPVQQAGPTVGPR
jgi:AcrR family transcriptional regulator